MKKGKYNYNNCEQFPLEIKKEKSKKEKRKEKWENDVTSSGSSSNDKTLDLITFLQSKTNFKIIEIAKYAI